MREPEVFGVDWELASSVARRTIAWTAPIEPDVLARATEDFEEATARAEALVAEVTGLRPTGAAKAVTVERAAWVDANLASFARLLGPALARAAQEQRGWRTIAPIGRQVAGTEVGALLAWLSRKVLGQYDAVPGSEAGADAVYYVAQNIVAIERRFGFAPKDFRLWVAVHEVTHRAQFRGVEWLEEYFLDLVNRGVSTAFDGKAAVAALLRAVEEIRSGKNPLAESGIVGLLASGPQLAAVREAQALMSLLEGHADVVMATVGDDVIPGASRFARVLAERRQRAPKPTRALHQILGFEAKLRQYREGEGFVERVIAARGMDGFSAVWASSANLPDLDEIRDPDRWLGRVGATASST